MISDMNIHLSCRSLGFEIESPDMLDKFGELDQVDHQNVPD